jgi:hypothetical protein
VALTPQQHLQVGLLFVTLGLTTALPHMLCAESDVPSNFAEILTDLQDDLLPIRAHALMELQALVLAKVGCVVESPLLAD